MRSFLLSAGALALLASSPANAAGGTAEALSYTWTGLYGGVNAAYGRQHSDWDVTSQSGNDGSVGLQFGYGGQFGDNLYLGLEASINTGGMEGKSSCFGGVTCKSQLNSFSDVSARFGVTSGPLLLFLKGGVAYEDTNYHVNSSADGGDGVGFLLGGGAEYALLYNLTTKLEYNFMDFSSDDHTIDGHHFSAKDDLNVVKLGFNFRFD